MNRANLCCDGLVGNDVASGSRRKDIAYTPVRYTESRARPSHRR